MSDTALNHQIVKALSSHGKIRGMTQTELAKHIGADRRKIGLQLNHMGNVARSGRGVSGDPFRYEYVPASVFCDESLNKPDPKGFNRFAVKFLLMGAGVLWWLERVIDALEWIF